MMKNNYDQKRIAIVTESLWKMAGSNRVLDSICEMYPNAQVYALFGDTSKLSENIKGCEVRFSFLNKIPFVKSFYRYTFPFWPIAIEAFDLSNYDLVISISSSVAHGVVTPLGCKHVSYINTPMRYIWDLFPLYLDRFRIFSFKNLIVHFIRIWDVSASSRSDVLIANSRFVSKRIKKYWGVVSDYIIHPPVEKFEGRVIEGREDYYVAGAPFEPNKKGDFLLECASRLGFRLKIIGGGSMKKRLERKYRNHQNIEFLGWISEDEKWEVLSKASGYIMPGIEDYGIFPVEALTCGTPVLAYGVGGSRDIVSENRNGMFFHSWSLEGFDKVFSNFSKKDWNYKEISKEFSNYNTKKMYWKEIENALVE